MNVRPLHISKIEAGDVFYEDASGEMMRCEAIESVSEDELGFTLKAITPLGEREFFEAKGGLRLPLYMVPPETAN